MKTDQDTHGSAAIDSSGEDTRFVSFNIMFDKGYEVSRHWVMHLRALECCGGTPPLTLNVTPSEDKQAPIELTLGVRDEFTTYLPGSPEHILYKEQITRGVWKDVVLQIQPGPVSMGRARRVGLWMNGIHVLDWSGNWGYPAIPDPNKGGRASNMMGIDVGTYRRRQASTQVIYFNDMRWGNTLASVTSPSGRS